MKMLVQVASLASYRSGFLTFRILKYISDVYLVWQIQSILIKAEKSLLHNTNVQLNMTSVTAVKRVDKDC